jgi:hypothetical protein
MWRVKVVTERWGKEVTFSVRELMKARRRRRHWTNLDSMNRRSVVKVHLKVQVKLSLCLTKHHAMKACWEWRYSSTLSFTSALDGGEWSASRPGRFTPREGAAGTIG